MDALDISLDIVNVQGEITGTMVWQIIELMNSLELTTKLYVVYLRKTSIVSTP